MKTIKLQNHPKLALVDDEDWLRLSAYKWFCNPCVSTIHRTERIDADGKSITKSRQMSNTVMTNYGCIFDHKDRNPFNNQKNNLRVCTNSQNNHNRRKRKGRDSKFVGVKIVNKGRSLMTTWCAYIRKNKKEFYLGSFLNEEDAARVYDIKAKELYGEFANLNFPNA